MDLTVMVMTDGRRDCITRSLASLHVLPKGVARQIIHDDSGDPAYRWWLRSTFPDWELVSTGKRQGFGGAYRSAWKILAGMEGWCFVTEDDFIYHDTVRLASMIDLLERENLTQVALMRQPWNTEESEAGGLPQRWGFTQHDGWWEHDNYFTTNPSVYRTELCKRGWPDTPNSEGVLSHRLRAEGARYGFYGLEESVEHIGTHRNGTGY